MGVKDLWPILTPHAERKPIAALRGKKVAIDLAGWVCEGLNVVDYFVHQNHHLKNLFFRTCYLIWEEVTPVFVLDGVAPKLKNAVIAKRNEVQFRGVRPKDKPSQQQQQQQEKEGQDAVPKKKANEKGRTRFNHVLKQCEKLLHAMGIQCVQGPGEAEAYCAFLNKNGLVDGVISQDSDCFAYGAICVYRNFSVSTQGALAAAGGSFDIYDMRKISEQMDFGQNKVIVMALLCGCDYCPEGIGGIGRDGVLKLFNKYKDNEILSRLRTWRSECEKYNELEMRVDDKTVCNNCGHIGRRHLKLGCGICRTAHGCDESLWKEQRLSIKAELTLRKKALVNPIFPCEEIIAEFLNTPATVPDLDLNWHQPNIVKFIKQIGHLLQWPEIYCFQKFFPIFTRWHVQNAQCKKQKDQSMLYIEPKEIVKKRTVRGVPSLEIIWLDVHNCFKGLIPEDQIRDYEIEHPKGIDELYYTVEPLNQFEGAFPEMVASFMKSKEKPKKTKKVRNTKNKNALENMDDLISVTNEMAKGMKQLKLTDTKAFHKKGLLKSNNDRKANTPVKMKMLTNCSTPNNKSLPSDLESDGDINEFDMSDIINGIITNPKAAPAVTELAGHRLQYGEFGNSIKVSPPQAPLNQLDDADLMAHKRNLSIHAEAQPNAKRYSLDDSFDLLVKVAKIGVGNVQKLIDKSKNLVNSTATVKTPINRFKEKHSIGDYTSQSDMKNVSYFFNNSACGMDGKDGFEVLMNESMGRDSPVCSS